MRISSRRIAAVTGAPAFGQAVRSAIDAPVGSPIAEPGVPCMAVAIDAGYAAD